VVEPAASDHAEQAAAAHGDENQDDDDEVMSRGRSRWNRSAATDVMEEVPERAFRPRRQYKSRKSSSAARYAGAGGQGKTRQKAPR